MLSSTATVLFLRNVLKSFFLSDGVNLEVLRDLSILQIHTRDLEGFRDTRFAILHLKSVKLPSFKFA